MHLPRKGVLAMTVGLKMEAKMDVEVEVEFVIWLELRRARGRAEEKRARPWLRAGLCNMKMWQ